MDYEDFKDLARRTASDKVFLRAKEFNLLKTKNMRDIKEALFL